MRFSLKKDIFLNIILPVLGGCCLYFICYNTNIGGFFRNQLPDGLWAYALSSTILIIWNRQINSLWVAFVFILFISFEVLQYFHFISGTGDVWDIIIYFSFATVALLLNNFYLNQKTNQDENYA